MILIPVVEKGYTETFIAMEIWMLKNKPFFPLRGGLKAILYV